MASIQKRPDGRWRLRYKDPNDPSREIAKHFARKVDAQQHLNRVTASVVSGTYVDPKAGKVTFRDYAETWRAAQVHRPSTQYATRHHLERHAYPAFGMRPISGILPSEIQAWVKQLGIEDRDRKRKALAPSTTGVVHSIVSSVFKSAVRDRVIASNPCEGTRLPRLEKRQVVPLTLEEVNALTMAVPPELRAFVTLAAGTGMRQGEVFGLTVDRIDFLRREVRVDRQLVTVVGQSPQLGPPKTTASVRTIPLPTVVVDALAAHLASYPAGPDGLVFTYDGEPISRQRIGHIWRPSIRAAGIARGTGLHALRHFYASLLIRHGESVKTVQSRLGHASAAETLDVYTHLWPDSDDRTREAVDTVLGLQEPVAADSTGS